MSQNRNRREFLQTSAMAGVGFWALGGVSSALEPKAAGDKMNVAFVGVGGMGGGNLRSVASAGENIVGLCDIDTKRLDAAGSSHPKAEKFTDFRKMYEKLGKSIDAVVVSTPDHMHAIAGVMAMKMGKHLYCEKPLTYCVNEARVMRKTAKEMKVATCMGNRGTATDGFRRGVEILRSGALGNVKEVHVWTNRPGKWWKQGMDRPKETPQVPKHVEWDLWLGCAPKRPYNPIYHPFHWRGWVDFGTGALGDMACHTANLAYMGLDLTYPTTLSAETAPANGETYPLWSTVVYNFPGQGSKPGVTLTWYDGMKTPREQNLPANDVTKGLKIRGSGSLIIGDKGILFSPSDYGDKQVFYTPERKEMKVEAPEPSLPRAPKQNNYLDWIRACKGGKPALGNFEYAAQLTEAVVLGNVAARMGKKIEYDAENMKVEGSTEGTALLSREYKNGYKL